MNPAQLIDVKAVDPGLGIVTVSVAARCRQEFAVSRLVSRLFTPVDPVVAVHDSAEQARAAIDRLGRAGFSSRMLKVVTGHLPDPGHEVAPTARPAREWHSSGAFLGLLWAALALAGAAVVAQHALPPAMVLLFGALVLAIQTAIMRSCLAQERGAHASFSASAPAWNPYANELAANRTLLLVSGSRSDIALARCVLSMRD